MVEGRLHITIVEAAKLKDKDKTDFNDSFVEVYLDEKDKQKTRTIMNDERPIWNETFIFDISSDHTHIHIDVYDEDEGQDPNFIGSTKISLNQVIETGHFDDWVKLPAFLGLASRGDIHIRMTYEKQK